jgi:hypothetical protein
LYYLQKWGVYMTTFEKIVKVLEQKGIKLTPMMKDLGFSTGLFSHPSGAERKPRITVTRGRQK